MSEEANTAEIDDARAVLKSVEQAKQAAVDAARPPIWLTAFATAMLGTALLGSWLMAEGTGSREAVTGLASLALLGAWGTHLIWLRRRGLKVRQIPSTRAGRWFLLGQAVFGLSVIALTGWLLGKGHGWVPWVSTAVLCTMFAFLMHRFPTGEPALRNGIH